MLYEIMAGWWVIMALALRGSPSTCPPACGSGRVLTCQLHLSVGFSFHCIGGHSPLPGVTLNFHSEQFSW